MLDIPSPHLRDLYLLRTANAALPPNKNARVFIRLGCAILCCAPLTLAKGVRTKVTHLRYLFRPDARNFPRRRKAGFGDVRRIFAFYLAQICAVQISGVIIEKSRRSCCFRCSPRLFTSYRLEEFHGAKRVVILLFFFIYIDNIARPAQMVRYVIINFTLF